MTNFLDAPTSLYSSMWSDKNVYQQQGLYKWAVDDSGSVLPIDPQFFRDIFKNGSVAQMKMFEQDFLCTYAWNTNLTTRDTTTGMQWLRAMDQAAAEIGIGLQLCMVTPLHALAATELGAVTNIRGSNDNMHADAGFMYTLGQIGLLLRGLGMFVSRDNVFTSSFEPGCGGSQNCTSPDFQIQNVAAMLAGGPFGPSDGVDFLNASMIARSCRPDGLLLRADRTFATSDAALLDPAAFAAVHHQFVWQTYSAPAASQDAVWVYVLALIVETALPAPLGRLGATPGLAYLAWKPLDTADAGGAAPATTLIPAGGALAVPVSPPAPPPGSDSYVGGDFFVLAPVLASGWALLGEQLKLVPASSRRFSSVLPLGGSGLSAVVRAANGESIAVWVQPPAGQVLGVVCPAGACDGEDCDVALVLACAGAACNCTLAP